MLLDYVLIDFNTKMVIEEIFYIYLKMFIASTSLTFKILLLKIEFEHSIKVCTTVSR